MRHPYVITPASGSVVTLSDAHLWCRITDDDTTQDPVITRLIAAAVDWVQTAVRRPLLTTQYGVKFDGFYEYGQYSHDYRTYFPYGFGIGWSGIVIPMPMQPVISVDSVKYINSSGILTTLDPSQYVVDTTSLIGRIYPAYGVTFPVPQPMPNSVTITFTAGYTSTPEALQTAVLMLVSHWYLNRESVLIGQVSSQLQMCLDALLAPYHWGAVGAV